MLYRKRQNGTKLYNAGILLLLAFAISACSTYDVKYIDREGIKSAAFAADKPRYHEGESKPMRLGALHFKDKFAGKDDDGRIILLQRKKGVYMAETKVGDDKGKKRYFLSIGVDPRTQKPAVGFRIEF